ncbi:MAG: isoprenylcysteine carboxylmethyltransferase family protein [Candidatus Aenigmarchaeota archaeon]|nr:isoprenylcysteine carboxylmethyltransferase family protein [Candidatus Aenigmarchaeota archaeon]
MNIEKTVFKLSFCLVLVICYTFGLGGNWTWINGWIFIALFMGLLFAAVLPPMKNLRLLKRIFHLSYQKERDFHDKITLLFFRIFLLIWFIIMPLDASRYNWSSEFPLWLSTIGVIGFLIANVLIYHIFKQKLFLVTVVKDKIVTTTGLYKIVRHPMYMAIILVTLSGAIVLNSTYGIYISAIIAYILYVRIIFEEKIYMEELIDYREYKHKVKHILIPYVF